MKNCQADLKKNQIKYLEMRRVTGIRNNVGETEDETQPRRELVNWKKITMPFPEDNRQRQKNRKYAREIKKHGGYDEKIEHVSHQNSQRRH